MRVLLIFYISFLFTISSCDSPMPIHFDSYPVYKGDDLGLTYSPKKSILKVWSPAVTQMRIHLYEKGDGDNWIGTKDMSKGQEGVWKIVLKGDWKNKYYNFQVLYEKEWLDKVPDPYAKAVGVNGHRAMFVDLGATNPKNWDQDIRPVQKRFNDIILYELHVRDISTHTNSGIQNRGKFLGLVEANTSNPDGKSTGLNHFKDLGITHVHLLPSFDFMPRSVDESKTEDQFNWGYDPQNYNVTEGSYSSNPYDGNIRIREFKEMVKTFHDNGIRVIMDVVYNHTGMTEESVFNQIAPGYYYRHNEDGSFSDASACGNETASERPMMRKFMMESMKYWVEEYHIDGFRVDLMGIHDITTMNQIANSLHEIDSSIFIYGEGWTGGDSPLPFEERSLKIHAPQLEGIAVFSDDIRDGLKGSVFNHEDGGFVSGKKDMEESIKFGIVGSTEHPQIDYSKVNYSDQPWAKNPSDCINYASCHDNHTLFDKLRISTKQDDEQYRPLSDLLKMHRLAQTIVLTSQGIPFLHAGTELLRSKDGVENSYKSSDEINQINWSNKTLHHSYFNYIQALISLRKNHPAFKMSNTEQVQKHLKFIPTDEELLIAYTISDHANQDSWKNILVILNGNQKKKTIPIPKGKWIKVLDHDHIDEDGIAVIENSKVVVKGIGATILVQR